MQLSRDTIKEAFRRMARIREFEERIHVLNEKGELPGFIHLSAGQEASCTGIGLHLTDVDHVTSTHRGHGHVLAKGCELGAMMDEIFARGTGICGGKGGSMHMADIRKGVLGANGIVGAGVPLAAGAALTSKTLGTGGVAVAFFGDGAYNEGATLETLNLAKVLDLPLLFALEDNGWGEATPSSYAIAGDISERARGFGIPATQCDGHDFFDVYETAEKVIGEIRAGSGPQLMHINVYRYYGHFEGDAATYREKGQAEKMREDKDCLDILRNKVVAAKILKKGDFESILQEVKQEVDDAVEHARKAPMPDPADLTKNVYASY